MRYLSLHRPVSGSYSFIMIHTTNGGSEEENRDGNDVSVCTSPIGMLRCARERRPSAAATGSNLCCVGDLISDPLTDHRSGLKLQYFLL